MLLSLYIRGCGLSCRDSCASPENDHKCLDPCVWVKTIVSTGILVLGQETIVCAGIIVCGRKRADQSSIVALVTGFKESLLFVWDRNSCQQFLVDTGAEVSVSSAAGLDTRIIGKSGPLLMTATGSTIRTYGACTIPLRFNPPPPPPPKYEWRLPLQMCLSTCWGPISCAPIPFWSISKASA